MKRKKEKIKKEGNKEKKKEEKGKFSPEFYTKYEAARILGARALQISANAPILLKLSKEQLESLNYDPIKITELEFQAGILPITVKRPMPKRIEKELPEEKAAEIVKKEKKLPEKKEKLPEEKAVVEEAEEAEAEVEEAKAEKESATEEEIAKEIAETGTDSEEEE